MGMGLGSNVSVGKAASRLTLGRFLEDVCTRYADREAVVSEDRRLGYDELYAESTRLARGLVGAGVVKGSRVALLMANRAEWITAAFAIGRVGGVIVPVSTFAKPAERNHILRHSDAALLLLQPRLLERHYVDELADGHPEIANGKAGRIRCPALPNLRSVFSLEGPERGAIATWKELLALGHDVPDTLISELTAEVEPSDDAFVIYTSGSTAQPKGVVHRHRAAVTQFWRFAEDYRLDDDERIYSAQPFFWTAGISMTLGCTLASGGTLLLQQVFDAGAALEMIEAERATHAWAWAHQGHALAEHPSARTRDLSSLRRLSRESALGRLLGFDNEPEWGIAAAFGMSETFTLCSSLPSDEPAALRTDTNGRPLPGMQIRIVDPETGDPRPVGEAGEIQVRGVTLMRGYHKVAPENVFEDDGYFATNDGGWFDADGYLHWSGRLDDLIKTGGANVSPSEIDRLLVRCPGLLTGLAVGLPHPTLGAIVVVCAVAMAGEEPTEDDVRGFLAEHLSAYKLPRRTLFFEEGELDTTANDKIRAEPLREAALTRLASEGAEIAGHRYGP